MGAGINDCDSRPRRVTRLECIHYNAQHNFTLQYPVLFAPLRGRFESG